jgi:hypothetical protein
VSPLSIKIEIIAIVSERNPSEFARQLADRPVGSFRDQ